MWLVFIQVLLRVKIYVENGRRVVKNTAFLQ